MRRFGGLGFPSAARDAWRRQMARQQVVASCRQTMLPGDTFQPQALATQLAMNSSRAKPVISPKRRSLPGESQPKRDLPKVKLGAGRKRGRSQMSKGPVLEPPPVPVGAAGAPRKGREFRVAIVGRPNVGKSTLFNRLSRRAKSIVTAIPGTTRDAKAIPISFGGMDITLVDTGGLEDDADNPNALGALASHILHKTEKAVLSCDMVLFVVDARAGLTEADRHFARWVRKRQGAGRNVVLLANKSEGRHEQVDDTLAEADRLGFGDPLPISAEHNEGMGPLATALVQRYEAWLKEAPEEPAPAEDGADELDEDTPLTPEEVALEQASPIQLAIVGRPNVGKSSILNAILKEDRALTGPMPGMTRDAMHVEWTWGGRNIRLVDTAGIRKWGKRDRDNKLEELSVTDAMRALNLAQVLVLVLDGAEGAFRRMELSLAARAVTEGRALVIAANKADLVGVSLEAYAEGVSQQVETLLPDLGRPPVVPLSAVKGQGVDKLMRVVIDAHDRWRRRVPTSKLNRWIKRIEVVHAPPRPKGKAIRLKYLTQVKRAPPTFVLSVNNLALPEAYQRFLTKNLQTEFGFHGMPVRLILRKPENPYVQARAPGPIGVAAPSPRSNVFKPTTQGKKRRTAGRSGGKPKRAAMRRNT